MKLTRSGERQEDSEEYARGGMVYHCDGGSDAPGGQGQAVD